MHNSLHVYKELLLYTCCFKKTNKLRKINLLKKNKIRKSLIHSSSDENCYCILFFPLLHFLFLYFCFLFMSIVKLKYHVFIIVAIVINIITIFINSIIVQYTHVCKYQMYIWQCFDDYEVFYCTYLFLTCIIRPTKWNNYKEDNNYQHHYFFA